MMLSRTALRAGMSSRATLCLEPSQVLNKTAKLLNNCTPKSAGFIFCVRKLRAWSHDDHDFSMALSCGCVGKKHSSHHSCLAAMLSFNFEKSASSPEISAKMCQIFPVSFGWQILDSFLVISWDSVHIFQNRFLHWNRESEYHEPHNPNNFFFTYKGVRAILSAISSSENGPNLNFWVQILV